MIRGKRIAVLVGIDEYQHQAWAPLSYVRNDIEGVDGLAHVLMHDLGHSCAFKPEDVHTLMGSDAHSIRVERLIWQKAVENAGPEDQVLIYFSGHGIVHTEGDLPVLVTFETAPATPHKTGLTFAFLEGLIKRASSRLILVIDACFSGRFLADRLTESDTGPSAPTSPSHIANETLAESAHSAAQRFAALKALAVFASCQPEQVSRPAATHVQSLFTQHFVMGLRGTGVALRSGKVDTHSLRAYLLGAFETQDQKPAILVPPDPFILSIPSRPIGSGSRAESLDEIPWKLYLETYSARYLDDPVNVRGAFVDIDCLRHEGSLSAEGFLPAATGKPRKALWDLRDHLLETDSGPHAFVILGDVGSGKSTLLRRLWLALAQAKLKDHPKAPIPLLVPLELFRDVRLSELLFNTGSDHDTFPRAASRFRAILSDLLQHDYGLPVLWSELEDACRTSSVVFLFDGLDEMGLNGEPNAIMRVLQLFAQFAQLGATIVLSCRTHFLRHDSELHWALERSLAQGTRITFYRLTKFSSSQVVHYIDTMSTSDEAAERCKLFITEAFKGTARLAERPFLLEILVKRTNALFAAPDGAFGPMRQGAFQSEHDVFEQFLCGWLERDRGRFGRFLHDFRDAIERDMIPDATDLGPPALEWAEKVVTRYIELLANDLRLSGTRTISYKEIPDRIRQRFPTLPDIFLNFFEYTLRTCSFLVRDDDGNYEFLHSSVLAYFGARAILHELRRKHYLWDVEHKLTMAIPHSLGREPLDDLTREFIGEMLHMDDRERLETWLRHDTKGNPNTLRYLGGNCLTILNYLDGGNLSNYDLRGTYICCAELHGVNLSNAALHDAVIENTDLTGANLENAHIEGAKFVRVRFDGANLRNVDLQNGGTTVIEPLGLLTARDPPLIFLRVIEESGKRLRKYDPLPVDDVAMVLIPGGRFWMGTDSLTAGKDERPAHEVVVSPFNMDVHPVTNKQFAKFVRANPDWGREYGIARTGNVYHLSLWRGDAPPPELMEVPVVYVSWFAAAAYAEWAGKRLPTEAEWEFALRNGNHVRRWDYPWERDIIPGDLKKHMGGTTGYRVREVAANAYGLYDMSGNVNEWVQDWYDAAYWASRKDEVANDPRGSEYGRYKILRGGSFLDHDSRVLRCSYRRFLLPHNTNQDGGFRCVKSSDR